MLLWISKRMAKRVGTLTPWPPPPPAPPANSPGAAEPSSSGGLGELAEEGEGVKEAMRPLAPTLAGWLSEKEPSEAVLGVIASACRDPKTALELRDERLPKRLISLFAARETKRWARSRRLQLLHRVQDGRRAKELPRGVELSHLEELQDELLVQLEEQPLRQLQRRHDCHD